MSNTIRSHVQTHYAYCRRSSSLMRCPARPATATAAGRQQSCNVQQLSTLLLVNENLRRRIGRGLVEPEQLLKAVELVQQAEYALLVAKAQHGATDPLQQLQHTSACQTLYANSAAQSLLGPQQHHQLRKVQLPISLAESWAQRPAPTQQHHGQQQQQQHSPCQVFQAVPWQRSSRAEQITLEQMLVCPVDAPNGSYLGLAVLFDRWSYPSEDCIGAPGFPKVQQSELPSEQQLQKAADAVRQQADAVRQLKQGQGLSNKDPQVVAAVAELQQLKQQLAHLEGLQATFQSNRQGLLQQLLKACS